MLPARQGGHSVANKRVTVTQESDTGRNTRFQDNITGETMTRAKFVSKIENGSYDNYYVRKIIVKKRKILVIISKILHFIESCVILS